MQSFFLRVFHYEQWPTDAERDLAAGQRRHDALEQAIRALELDPSHKFGGFVDAPSLLGLMELGGAFVDSDSRACGAAAGVTYLLPMPIARGPIDASLRMLLGKRCPDRTFLFMRGRTSLIS